MRVAHHRHAVCHNAFVIRLINKHVLHMRVTNTRLWQKWTRVCGKPLTETGENLHASAVSSYWRRVLPTRVRDKIRTRLCEEPYLRHVSVIRVCSKNPTIDDICKRVCVKKHSVDACAIHASIVRILLQTMFVNMSVWRNIVSARV